MRVLHVIQRYWPYTGGSERHLQEISERLVADGHSVTVFTTDAYDLELFWNPNKRRVKPAEDMHNGVAIHRFPVRHLPVPQYTFPGLRWAMTNLSDLPLNSAPLLERLSGLAPFVPGIGKALSRSASRFDIICGMNICFESLLVPAFGAARKHGRGFVVMPLTHLGEGDESRVRRYYTMRHQIRLIARSDAVLVQTDLEKQYLEGRGISPRLMVKAGVGVNPAEVLGGQGERFRSKYGITGPIVFYLGTTAFDKGTVHLVEAMTKLWAAGQESTLVLAGPMMDHFTRFLDGQPDTVRARVRRLGFIPEEDKKDLLAAGSVMAMPSRTDSFGIVYLEAWLYGKPVIGAIAGGVPEVIEDGKDGYLVQFGDVGILASRLHSLLGHPEEADAMGERGREKVLQRYTWDRIYPVVRDTYERVLARRRSARPAGLGAE